MSSKLNNIDIFNKLTHDDKCIDEMVFDKLIEDFQYYILFKKMYTDKMKIKKARCEKSHIKFRVQFDSIKTMRDFIKVNEDHTIKHDKEKYLPVFNEIGQQIIDIYFIKK